MFHIRCFAIIVLVFTKHTTCNSTQKILRDITINNPQSKDIIDFLRYVRKERNYPLILILAEKQDVCINIKQLMEHVQVLLLSSNQKYILQETFNGELLTLVCLENAKRPELLNALAQNLFYQRSNRVVLISNQPQMPNLYDSVVEYFRFCERQHMWNVIAVPANFPGSSKTFYAYTKFPSFHIIERSYNRNSAIFPNRLNDMQGHPIRTLPDQIEPRSILYLDAQGKQQMGGYTVHFLKHFAKRYNATLILGAPVKVGVSIFYNDMLNYTRNGTVDIPASLTGPFNETKRNEHSYPLELANWCVMLPMEETLTVAEIYMATLNSIFTPKLLVLILAFSVLLTFALWRSRRQRYYCFALRDIIFNDKALRGVLGLSFDYGTNNPNIFLKYTFILMFVTGLIITTIYGVYLKTFMTHPPRHALINSFADLQRSQKKLLISRPEYRLIYPEDYLQYQSMFEIIDSFIEFLKIRHTLNTTYAYPMPSSRWPIYQSQQRIFSRPLFRLSQDMCFWKYIHLHFLLPTNSIYYNILNQAILQVHDFGLIHYWFSSGFDEMVRLGRMSYADWSAVYEIHPITFEDVKTVNLCFLLGLMSGSIVFVLELVVVRLQRVVLQYKRRKVVAVEAF